VDNGVLINVGWGCAWVAGSASNLLCTGYLKIKRKNKDI